MTSKREEIARAIMERRFARDITFGLKKPRVMAFDLEIADAVLSVLAEPDEGMGAETERLLLAAKGDFVCGDDGLYVFWPTENRGAFSAWMLRALAGELDRRNAGWEAKIEAHFSDSCPIAKAREG